YYHAQAGNGLNLTNNNPYWVIKIDDDTITLAASATDAIKGNAIAIAPNGNGTYTLTAANSLTTSVFTGGAVTASDTISLPAHGMSTGQAVLNRAGSGTPITGLDDNTVYFVIAASPDTIELAATLQDALANRPLTTLANPGDATQHSLTRVVGFQDIANVAGDAEPDTFALLGAGRLTGLING